MLSNENPNAPTTEQLSADFRAAATAARTLGHKLITGQHNDNPHNERNAPNPATAGVYIRVLRPVPVFLPVDEECKRHNDLVANLGVMPKSPQPN